MKRNLKFLSQLTSAKLIGDEQVEITGVNTLEKANASDASFLANPRYEEVLKTSQAGVFCVSTKTALDPHKNYLISEDPSFTFQIIAEHFLPSNKLLTGFEGIHEPSFIHKSAKIAKNVTILPNATIDKNAQIEENTFIGAGVYLGANVKIGKNCIIHANVVIRENCILHNNVIIQPGAIIGSCGFGYLQNKKGAFTKILQIGNVVIEDEVEIGANTCIDRARFASTIIKKGTKIDNLVQIAHNVEIGQNNAIAAQTGIAGSSKTGNFVIMGGQVGVTGHVSIADKTMLATRSGVSKNLKEGKYRGSPAIELEKYNKQYIAYKNLEKTLKNLQEKIAVLEEKTQNI